MKAGPYTYNDGRREAFIILREGMTIEGLPTRLNITIKGEAWPAYLSSGIRCSRCRGQGHRRANCPLLAGRTSAPGPATPTSPTSVPSASAPGLPQQPSAQPPPPASPSPAMEVSEVPSTSRAALPPAAPRQSPPVAPAIPTEMAPPAPPPVAPAPSLRAPGSHGPAVPTLDVEMSIEETSTSRAALKTSPAAVPPTPPLPAPQPAGPIPPAPDEEEMTPIMREECMVIEIFKKLKHLTCLRPLYQSGIQPNDIKDAILFIDERESLMARLTPAMRGVLAEFLSAAIEPARGKHPDVSSDLAKSPGCTEKVPERPSILLQTGEELSPKNENMKKTIEISSNNHKDANPPAGDMHVNPAAARGDVTAPKTAATTSATAASPTSLNWADSEMTEVGANDDFIVVKGKKRRRGSTPPEHAARQPNKPGEQRSSQQRKRPAGPRAVPPQEIKATRVNIADARARQATTNHENYIFVELCPDIPDYSYLKAIGSLVGGPKNITQFNRMNGHYIVGLASKNLASRLVEEGLNIEGTLLKVFPFRKRAERIIVANLPGFVEDATIVQALRKYGNITSIAPIMIKMGEYAFSDGRREAFILLHEGVRLETLPTRLTIHSKGDTLSAFLSFGIKCSKCGKQGHRRANCPALARQGNGNPRQAASPTDARPPPPPPPQQPRKPAPAPATPASPVQPAKTSTEVQAIPSAHQPAEQMDVTHPTPAAHPASPAAPRPPEHRISPLNHEMSVEGLTSPPSTPARGKAALEQLLEHLKKSPNISIDWDKLSDLNREEVQKLLTSETTMKRRASTLTPAQVKALNKLHDTIKPLCPDSNSTIRKTLQKTRKVLREGPQHHVDIAFVQETNAFHLGSGQDLCLGYSAVVLAHPVAISGSGLACVFGPGVAVLHQRILWPGHIALATIDVRGEEMTAIAVYLAHEPRERNRQLELLAATAAQEEEGACWIIGDFNIRDRGPSSSSSSDALAALLDLAALVDVATQFDAAHLPTRVAMHGDQVESNRLDRILVPAGVLDRASIYATSHYHLSDHRLVLLQLEEDAAHDDDDGTFWDRWTSIKAGLLAEARSLHDPRHAASDSYVYRARRYIAAQLEASSIRADYPSLPDLARAIRLRRPVSVIRDEEDNVIEGPELRRRAFASFQPRFARPTSDPAAGAAFIASSAPTTTTRELSEEDPLHRPDISPSEIAHAIEHLPRGKAPGWDGLPCELLVAFNEDFFAEALARVFAASRLRGALPPSTRRSSICLVPKARGGRGLDGYRPVALPSADYRVLAAILHRRLKPHLRTLVPECQTYAVPGRSPSWNIAKVTDAVEEATAMGSPLAVMGIDLESAFDSLDRGFLESLMTSLRLPPAFMGWINILYAGADATIRAGGFHTTAFPLLNGLRQGCAVSAALFSIATGPLLRRLELTLGVGNVIAYADDIVLLFHRDEEFERVATVLEDFKRASGIAVNLGKSAGLWCGAWRNRGDSPLGASWSTTSIRVLGLDIAPRSSVAHQEQHLLALLESACRRWTPFTRGLSLVGRSRAANSLVSSTIQHHLHGYLPSPPTIAKLQARLARFVWGPEHTAWLPAAVMARPVAIGGLGLLDLATQLQLACLKGVQVALRGGRNAFSWLVESGEAWIHPPPDGTRLQPRRLRLLKLWEEASNILSLNHRALPTAQLLDLPIIGGCRFLRPPDLLAPARWRGARVRDLLAEGHLIARPTRSVLADAATLGAFCRRLTSENAVGFGAESVPSSSSLAAAVVLRGTATPFLNGLTTRSARRALDRPRLAATPISRFTSIWSPTIGPPPSRIDWASLRRCAHSGHEADAALKLALHALPQPAHPASVGPSCPACGSIDRSLGHRYWCCRSIRPLIREAFNIIGQPPDLQAWIFGGSGLEDDALSILASAKLRIYRYFVQVGLGEAVEDPLIAWSRTLQRRGFLPPSPITILDLGICWTRAWKAQHPISYWCEEIKQNEIQKIILRENSENRIHANPPAGVKDVNLAAARDVTLDLPAGTSSNGAARALRNWADCPEDQGPGADDDFTVVRTKKRRRESANSPTAAAPSSNIGGARTSRRPQSSAGSVPRAQEVRTTRAHITEARARQASSSEDHCIYLEHGPELQPFHYLRALDRMLGGTAGVIQVSKVNGHQLLGLANRGLAERLINEGLEVEGTLLRAFPFRKRAERITVGNLPFFVEDSAIISALKPYGRVTSIAPKLMKAGPYTYNDGRREAFIVLREGMTTERLPTRLEIPIKGEAWPAYLSSGIKCSRCHGQGHRRANCPLLAGRANNYRLAPPTSPAGVPSTTTSAPPQRSAAQPPAPAPSSTAMEIPGASHAARAVTPSAAPRPSTPVASAVPMEMAPPAPPPVAPAPSLRAPGSHGPAVPTLDVEITGSEPGEKFSPENMKNTKENSFTIQKNANSPAGDTHVNLAAARDVTAPTTAASLSENPANPASLNWADSEMAEVSANDDFIVVKGKKRRRGSTSTEHAARQPNKPGDQRSSQQRKRPTGPRAVPPQEIKATRANIAAARARQTSSTHENYVFVELCPDIPDYSYLRAMSRLFGGPGGITQFNKMNSHYIVGLETKDLARRLVEGGLEIDGTTHRVFPYRKRAERIIIANLPGFVEDRTVVNALGPYGKVTSIAPIMVKMGEFTFTDGRREAFILLNDGIKLDRLPTRLEIQSKGDTLQAFLSFGIKCSKCGKQGHRIANCPALAGEGNGSPRQAAVSGDPLGAPSCRTNGSRPARPCRPSCSPGCPAAPRASHLSARPRDKLTSPPSTPAREESALKQLLKHIEETPTLSIDWDKLPGLNCKDAQQLLTSETTMKRLAPKLTEAQVATLEELHETFRASCPDSNSTIRKTLQKTRKETNAFHLGSGQDLCLGYNAVVLAHPVAISGSGLACVFGPGVAVIQQRVLWPGRIALATIDVHGEEMTAIVVHLAHEPRERNRQLELLAATAAQEEEGACWIIGEFNIRDRGPSSSSSSDALAALLDLAALVDVATQFDAAHLPTRVAMHGDQVESNRLDRILVPAGVLDRVSIYATSHYHLSDHRLVLLQVGPPTTAVSSPTQPRLAAMLRSGLALDHLAGYIRELEEDTAHDDDDGTFWDRWTSIKAELLAEARSLHDPRHAASDSYVYRARLYIAAQLEASSIRADYPSLPDLARAIRLRRPVSVIRDEEDNVIEGPELRRRAFASFQPRFARPTSDPAAGAAFIASSAPTTTTRELSEEDPLHRPDISPSEIAHAIEHLPRGKAPGWDGLPCELLIAFNEDFFAEALARVFAASRLRGALPPSTRRSSICLLPKARGGRGLDGYRPVALPSADYRVLAAILHRRLKPHLRTLVPECQTYAVPGRSPSWNIAMVTDAVEEATALGSPLAVMGVDLESAFDSLDRGFLESLLTAWINILYAGADATIRAGGFYTTAFPLLNGLRQGCAVSAALFSIATGPLLRRLELTLGVGNVIAYADDIVLLFHRDGDFERVATVFEEYKQASGVGVNLRKSAGLWCGAWRNRGDSPLGASWSTTSIRVLGLDIAPRSTHLLALLETACRKWTPFTRGLSLVGRARAANTLVGSVIQHHLHGYLPSPPTIAKLQARLARFVWGQDHMAWLPADVMARPVAIGGLGLLDLATQLQLACLKGVQVALRGGRNAFSWLVGSNSGEAWIHPPPDGTRLQPRRHRLLKLWEEASNILGLNHRAVPTAQLLDLPIIGGCRFLRPPDLLAPARWSGAREHLIARPTRSGVNLRSRFLARWTPTINPPARIDWASLRRCAYPGHEADAALKLTLHALPHPASVGPSCPACGSIDRSLGHRYWCCRSIRPLIREAFNIIGRPPDLQAWIFGGSGLEDDALSILASAKLRIYRYFVQVGLGEAVEDPLIAWSKTLQRRGLLPLSPLFGRELHFCGFQDGVLFQDSCLGLVVAKWLNEQCQHAAQQGDGTILTFFP
ncbi:hypothetical protein LAZ67_6001970 [Cordylochernes scorpioides]|uniref:Reverse transcriptase n=1 Tax=Cordylochernes scorpioides TaxID=51811 RepID=A0ABY6KML9_9ARAC|nr:hypothetical protein LAZ67_6001970 [Cordylochernes scorpioides]